jgi:hypothetical protein
MAEPPSRAARIILALERKSDRRWFLPAVGIFPLSDYVLPFLPNQMLLVGLSMVLRHRWLGLAATFVIASGLGAMLVAYVIQSWGVPVVEALFDGLPEPSAAAPVIQAVQDWGLVGLAGLAMLPWPPRTAVLVCAIAGLPPLLMGLSVAAGRTVPVLLYAGVGARAPQLLRRFARVDRVLTEIEQRRSPAPGSFVESAPLPSAGSGQSSR